MKSEKKILIAFFLNLFFSLFEFFGGIFTNSILIMSDAVHDFGDTLSIGISFVLEKISKKKANLKYSYGYARYSILGAFITTIILTVGSIFVIINGINRLISPVIVNYNGMFFIAVIGVLVNFCAMFLTKGGKSLNQKAVNLHMLEDVLGWLLVLFGAILIKFTNINIIDSILSICVALFILYNSFNNLKEILDIFLEKTPKNIKIEEIKNEIVNIRGIIDVHHIHIWTIDGSMNYITMHVVTNLNKFSELKNMIKNKMKEYNINHCTIEIENDKEICNEKKCHYHVDFSHFNHNH